MLGLRTTIYQVPDLAAAKTWYTQAFTTAPYFDEPFYVGFNIGGFELGLLPAEKATTGQPDNVLSYWGVEDIETVYQHLISLGATTHEAPHSVGGPLLVATVRDPWDNIIGLIYNPTFPNTITEKMSHP
ncbi:VOC family protein [Lewinella cohaerens]|uniref:VOC family protein n=1 Tax=Lewinella cohaerens TaxID=70995 RepID=UPI0003817BE7|nr:VOC family protein [Lewinella cohaerens]